MKNWLNDIQDKLGDFETKAPEGLWARIESAKAAPMATSGASDSSDALGRNAAVILWARRMATVGAVAAAVIAGVLLFGGHHETTQDKLIADSHPDIETAEGNVSNNAPDSPVTETPEMASPAQRNTNIGNTADMLAQAANKSEGGDQNKPALGEDMQTEPRPQLNDPQPRHTEQPAQENERQTNDTEQQLGGNDAGGKTTVVPLYREEKARKRKSGTGTMSIGIINSYGTQRTDLLAYGGAVTAVAGPEENVSWDESPTLGMMLYNRGVGDVKFTHRMPVRVGVTLDWQLGDRWFLESGLTYTRLNSQIRQGNETDYSMAEQKLDYIGIPLNVKFKAFGTRYFGLYATAGMNMDKCVSAKSIGSYEFTTDWGRESGSLGTEKYDEKPLQFSANLAAGVAYLITPLVSLYAEPGMSWYFDDKSSLNTIYKERPLNFSMNMGLRFTLPHGR